LFSSMMPGKVAAATKKLNPGDKVIDRSLSFLLYVATAAFTAVTFAYIAHFEFGLAREQIRTCAVIAASVGVALVVIRFFGKKLRKLD
jgi:hypothetical protein